MNNLDSSGNPSERNLGDVQAAPTPKKAPLLIRVLVVLVAVVLIFVGIVAMQPSDFRIERSTTISAPPADVFPHVNDFHAWEAWSPWEKLDPSMTRTYEGPPTGTGSIYSWVGDANVGEGRMSITESQPNDLIKIKLEFIKPFAGTNAVDFNFKPEGDQTLVTWTMNGQYSFIPKAMNLVMNMDKMIGDSFESGLAQLKSVVEASAAK